MADTQSILDSIKKVLGLGPDYTDFDTDVIMHINSAFMTLSELGIGPSDGFIITDSTGTWGDYTSDIKQLAGTKTYVFLKVRMAFDPPATSFALDAMAKMISELEWRLNVATEALHPPTSPDGSTGGSGGGEVAVQAFWWDLTGGADFPDDAVVGDMGFDSTTGDVWSCAA